MNNQNLMLLALGVFVALIVTVAAVDQYLLDEHPPTQVEGLIWLVENAFNRIQDLEATLQVTNESQPAENVRMKVRYVKGPPPVLSMRYVPPQDASEDLFVATVRDETFTVQNDQLFHYLPSEDIIVSKRWPGVPLVAIGLSIFDVAQLRIDWIAGKTEIKILQNITGFSGFSFATSVSVLESFSHASTEPSALFSVQGLQSSQSYSLCFSFCPEFQEGGPQLTLGLAEALNAETGSSIPGSYILEVRDADTQDLLRMIWIDRETYLIQKVVTFEDGQRSATLLVQLMTIDQGLTEAEVITPPQAGVENIRG
ncbi:hypothetical protein KAJ02_12815 [Candidatus Bipolaricaulota bacterium]|nr:hypothetical protein [Candidatus Bipolaricaulota bacterium]